jgi:hypothetical protein
VTSRWQTEPVWHATVSQRKPTGAWSLQPTPGVHPLAQLVGSSASPVQRCSTVPSQRTSEPSHSTQRDPSLLHERPFPQPAVQQMVVPERDGAQAANPHSASVVQG